MKRFFVGTLVGVLLLLGMSYTIEHLAQDSVCKDTAKAGLLMLRIEDAAFDCATKQMKTKQNISQECTAEDMGRLVNGAEKARQIFERAAKVCLD